MQTFNAIVQLLPRGQKIFAIVKGPAVILHAGKFHATRAGLFHNGEHFLEFVNIAAMDDEIQSEADAIALEPFENAQLVLMGLCAGNAVGGFFARSLEAELEMIES